MIHTHPDEMAVQEYVVNNSSNPEVAAHIEQCPHCLALVAEYQLLFDELKEGETPAFDFDLTQLVMAQLPQPAAKKKATKAVTVTAWLLVVAACALLFYFIQPMLAGLFNGIASMLLYLIATAAICISVALLVDMFKRHRQQMNSLNNYA